MPGSFVVVTFLSYSPFSTFMPPAIQRSSTWAESSTEGGGMRGVAVEMPSVTIDVSMRGVDSLLAGSVTTAGLMGRKSLPGPGSSSTVRDGGLRGGEVSVKVTVWDGTLRGGKVSVKVIHRTTCSLYITIPPELGCVGVPSGVTVWSVVVR